VETFDVELAGARFIEDAKSRHLAVETTNKYKLMFKEMGDFFGKKELKHISVDDLSAYRNTWKMAPITSLKKLERLKAFLGFCKARGWVKENRAVFLKTPKTMFAPTLPFDAGEWEKILWATEVFPIKGIYGEFNRTRLKAFVMLLRYTGLRIRDAVMLKREHLDIEDKKKMYQEKTGTPVWIPVPHELAKLIDEVWRRNKDRDYFFWSGLGNAKSAVGDWQRTLRKLHGLAGVKGHAHMYRDTFAVDLLQKGVPIETVSILLGHSSIRITEKHYSPWVKSRQDNLETQIRKIWISS